MLRLNFFVYLLNQLKFMILKLISFRFSKYLYSKYEKEN